MSMFTETNDALIISTSYSRNLDGTITITRSDGIPQRINKESCQNAVETITKNKDFYITEGAYNKALSIFKGAMACFHKESE